jgi:hypothetical protein
MDVEKPQDLRARTKQFALRVMRLADALGEGRSTGVICRQLIRTARKKLKT